MTNVCFTYTNLCINLLYTVLYMYIFVQVIDHFGTKYALY